MKVEQWFAVFVDRLIVRSARNDWPKLDTDDGAEYWRDFRRALVRCGASEDEADEASSLACESADLWPNQAKAMVVGHVRAIQARKQAAAKAEGKAAPSSREEAALLSRDCDACSGDGLMSRFVHASHAGRFATAGGRAFPVGSRVTLFCGCPLGMLLHGQDTSRPAIASAAAFPELLWERQYRYHPDNWDAMHGEPIAETTPEAIRAMLDRSVAARKAPSNPATGHPDDGRGLWHRPSRIASARPWRPGSARPGRSPPRPRTATGCRDPPPTSSSAARSSRSNLMRSAGSDHPSGVHMEAKSATYARRKPILIQAITANQWGVT